MKPYFHQIYDAMLFYIPKIRKKKVKCNRRPPPLPHKAGTRSLRGQTRNKAMVQKGKAKKHVWFILNARWRVKNPPLRRGAPGGWYSRRCAFCICTISVIRTNLKRRIYCHTVWGWVAPNVWQKHVVIWNTCFHFRPTVMV